MRDGSWMQAMLRGKTSQKPTKTLILSIYLGQSVTRHSQCGQLKFPVLPDSALPKSLYLSCALRTLNTSTWLNMRICYGRGIVHRNRLEYVVARVT